MYVGFHVVLKKKKRFYFLICTALNGGRIQRGAHTNPCIHTLLASGPLDRIVSLHLCCTTVAVESESV